MRRPLTNFNSLRALPATLTPCSRCASCPHTQRKLGGAASFLLHLLSNKALRGVRNAGFMLIELAIAALVIAIGILALLGVAHVGERAASDSANETAAMLFADEAFTTLRLYSDQVSATTNQQGWIAFWRDFSEGRRPLPLANMLIGAESATELENAGLPSLIGDGALHINRWFDTTTSDTNLAERAVQYRLTITQPGDTGASSFAGSGGSDDDQIETLWATLHVWNGAFRTHQEPFTFYTHFAHTGGLP